MFRWETPGRQQMEGSFLAKQTAERRASPTPNTAPAPQVQPARCPEASGLSPTPAHAVTHTLNSPEMEGGGARFLRGTEKAVRVRR